MAKDFRARQVRTNKIIGRSDEALGAGNGAKVQIAVMKSGSANFSGGLTDPTVSNQADQRDSGDLFQNVFARNVAPTSNIGSDVWMVVDGGSSNRYQRSPGESVLFLGDVIVSGTLYTERQRVNITTTTLTNAKDNAVLLSGSVFVTQDQGISVGKKVGGDGANASLADPYTDPRDAVLAKDGTTLSLGNEVSVFFDGVEEDATEGDTGDTLPQGLLVIRPNDNDGAELRGKIGIGVANPDAKLEILATGEQLRLSHDAGNFVKFTVGPNGNTEIESTDAGTGEGHQAGHIALLADGCVDFRSQVGQFRYRNADNVQMGRFEINGDDLEWKAFDNDTAETLFSLVGTKYGASGDASFRMAINKKIEFRDNNVYIHSHEADGIQMEATGNMLIGTTLADAKSLTLGNTSSTHILLSPHETAENEKILIKNSAGSAVDALKIEAAAGGLDIDAGTQMTLTAAGGDVTIEATADDAKTVIRGNAEHVGDAITAIHLDGNASGNSKIHVDAGILDMDASSTATFDAGSSIGIAAGTGGTGTLSAKGATGASFGDNTGTWEFNGSGALSETGVTTFDLTPGSTANINSVGALTIDSSATIGIGTDDVDQAINIGTAGNRTITIGEEGNANTSVIIRSEAGMVLDAGTNAVTITGDLTVTGATTTINTTNITVEDPLIELARNQGANNDTLDIGFFGKYGVGGIHKYAGLFRDADDSGKFHLFKDTTVDLASATTIERDGAGYTKADLVVNSLDVDDAGGISATTTINLTAPNIELGGDGAVLKFGAADNVTLTHVTDTGLLLNSSMQLQFGHADKNISGDATDLFINSGGRVIETVPGGDGSKGHIIQSANNYSQLSLQRIDGTISDGDILGLITFGGSEDDGATRQIGAQIEAVAEQNWYVHPTAGDGNSTSLRFLVKPPTNDFLFERMRIAPDGKVGIGTTAPATKLEVAGTVRSTKLEIPAASSTVTLTGTVTAVSGLSVISGTGTAFVSEVSVGDEITVSGVTKTVVEVNSNTLLTVNSAWTAAGSGLAATIKKEFAANQHIGTETAGTAGNEYHVLQIDAASGNGAQSNFAYVDLQKDGTSYLRFAALGGAGFTNACNILNTRGGDIRFLCGGTMTLSINGTRDSLVMDKTGNSGGAQYISRRIEFNDQNIYMHQSAQNTLDIQAGDDSNGVINIGTLQGNAITIGKAGATTTVHGLDLPSVVVSGDEGQITFNGSDPDPIIKRDIQGQLLFTDKDVTTPVNLQTLAANNADDNAFTSLPHGDPGSGGNGVGINPSIVKSEYLVMFAGRGVNVIHPTEEPSATGNNHIDELEVGSTKHAFFVSGSVKPSNVVSEVAGDKVYKATTDDHMGGTDEKKITLAGDTEMWGTVSLRGIFSDPVTNDATSGKSPTGYVMTVDHNEVSLGSSTHLNFTNANTDIRMAGNIEFTDATSSAAAQVVLIIDQPGGYVQLPSTKELQFAASTQKIHSSAENILSFNTGQKFIMTTGAGASGASGASHNQVSGLYVHNAGSSGSYYAFRVASNGAGNAFTISNTGMVGIGHGASIMETGATEHLNARLHIDMDTTAADKGGDAFRITTHGNSMTGDIIQSVKKIALTGTLFRSESNTFVVGTDTAFRTELKVGDSITIDGETRTVSSIVNDTQLYVVPGFESNGEDSSAIATRSLLTFDSAGRLGIGETSPDESLHIKSDQKAAIILEADTDNGSAAPVGSELGTAFVKMTQDAGLIGAILGLTPDLHKAPDNSAYNNAQNNSLLVGTTSANSVHIGSANTVRMTISYDGNISFHNNTFASTFKVGVNREITPGDGSMIHVDGAASSLTLTDSNTAESGTAALFSAVRLEGPTLEATNSSVTTTDAATLYIDAAPVAGTNQTITNTYSIWVDAGLARFDGGIETSGTVTATSFAGGLAGNADTATTASVATQVTVTVDDAETPANENNLIAFVADAGSASGNHGLEMDGGFHYNPSTGAVTATKFVGALDGNANTATSAGTATSATNATNATTAAQVTVADESVDTACFPLFVTAATGDLAPKSGDNLTFNSNTGLLTATALAGSGAGITALNANNIGAGTINNDRLPASATSITSVGTLTSLDVSGDLTVDTTTLKVDSTNNNVGIGTASPSDVHALHVVGLTRLEGNTLDLGTATMQHKHINIVGRSGEDVMGFDLHIGGQQGTGLADGGAIVLQTAPAGSTSSSTSNARTTALKVGTTSIEVYRDFIPNGTVDLGSSSNRFANIYTNDLNLCNEGRGNDVDGTSGNWTIQEGKDNLYVINNITGKKYKMALTPVD